MTPNWQPDWDDVRFDHGAASEAVAECRQAINTLNSVGHAHARAAMDAQSDWSGSASDRFSEQRTLVEAAIEGAVEALQDAIDAIQRAATAATNQQAARVESRRRWHAEMAAAGA